MPKEKIPEKLTQQKLEQFLWEAADILRGAVQPPRYKFYILPLLFYKRLSDVYEEEYHELLEKYHVEEIAKKKFHRFLITKNCSWEEIRKISKDIGEKLNQALKQIAKENPELEGVINRTDFNDREELPEARLFKLMEHFSRAKLGNENVEPDILGRAYEYLIKQFALAEARKGGGILYSTRSCKNYG
jgi:type I restriction enzyme M protein